VQKQTKSKRQMLGYSIVELLVAMAIIFIFSAFAAPTLIETYRSYQMDDAASQVAAILKFTRYEAIRRNNVLNCQVGAIGGLSVIFSDNNGNGVADANEKQVLLSGPANLVAAGTVPGSAALTAVVGAGALTTVNPANGVVTFDGRGAKSLPAGISVFWVGNATYGWRAVTVMPSGSIQVWSYATGTWQQLS